jgi:hypothetical protein
MFLPQNAIFNIYTTTGEVLYSNNQYFQKFTATQFSSHLCTDIIIQFPNGQLKYSTDRMITVFTLSRPTNP